MQTDRNPICEFLSALPEGTQQLWWPSDSLVSSFWKKEISTDRSFTPPPTSAVLIWLYASTFSNYYVNIPLQRCTLYSAALISDCLERRNPAAGYTSRHCLWCVICLFSDCRLISSYVSIVITNSDPRRGPTGQRQFNYLQAPGLLFMELYVHTTDLLPVAVLVSVGLNRAACRKSKL